MSTLTLLIAVGTLRLIGANRRATAVLLVIGAGPLIAGFVASAARPRRIAHHLRVARLVVVSAAVLVGVGMAALSMSRFLGQPAPPGSLVVGQPTSTAPTASPGVPTVGVWTETAPAPIASRSFPAAAWTGSVALVWSGIHAPGEQGFLDAPLADDGAAYDPDADTWRPISIPPLAPRWAAASVWAGDGWLVWGGAGADGPLGDGAVYDPETDSWQLLAPAPLEPRYGAQAVWTGEEVVVTGGLAGALDAPDPAAGAAAYNPADETWRELAPPPETVGRTNLVGRAVWSGDNLYVWLGGGGLRYDPAADRWAELPQPPEVTGSGAGAVVWAGGRLIIGGIYPSDPAGFGLAYDPASDSYQPIPRALLRIDPDFFAVAVADTAVFITLTPPPAEHTPSPGEVAARWLPHAGAWQGPCPPRPAIPASTGSPSPPAMGCFCGAAAKPPPSTPYGGSRDPSRAAVLDLAGRRPCNEANDATNQGCVRPNVGRGPGRRR